MSYITKIIEENKFNSRRKLYETPEEWRKYVLRFHKLHDIILACKKSPADKISTQEEIINSLNNVKWKSYSKGYEMTHETGKII